jgi:apolipoprotein N-acyltransferase
MAIIQSFLFAIQQSFLLAIRHRCLVCRCRGLSGCHLSWLSWFGVVVAVVVSWFVGVVVVVVVVVVGVCGFICCQYRSRPGRLWAKGGGYRTLSQVDSLESFLDKPLGLFFTHIVRYG